jgi:alginate O-acetyltransferase complex protein AlgI
MHLLTPEFTLAVIVLFVLHWAIPARWRPALLMAAGLAFAASHALAFTVLYVLLGLGCYLAGRRLDDPEQRKPALLVLGLIVLLGNLTVWKFIAMPGSDVVMLGRQISDTARESFPTYARVAIPVGISYLSFRLVHYLVERYRGKLADTGLVDFLSYVFFFPVFLAGPLLRFDEYNRSRSAERPGLVVLNGAMARILIGVGKKMVADPIGAWAHPILMSPDSHPPELVVGALYAASFQLYMDFSGYSDIAIGLGRLFGITIPENFSYPFFKKNIAEFWRHWHISLHRFFRDYVFFPLFGYRATTAKLYLGIGVTIFLFQVWHQASLNFVLLGVFHGLGVMGHQLFQRFQKRRPRLRKFMGSKAMGPVCVLLTVSFFSMGNVLFMTDAVRFVAVIERLLGF